MDCSSGCSLGIGTTCLSKGRVHQFLEQRGLGTNRAQSDGWTDHFCLFFDLFVHLLLHLETSCTDLSVSDSAAHLSEEVKDAAKSVPKAMMWSFVLNGIVGLIVLVTFLFAIPDISAALSPETNPTGVYWRS